MTRRIQLLIPVFMTTLFVSKSIRSQDFQDVGSYMEYISKANEQLSATYLSYLSAVAHNSARKAEKRRQDVVTAISDTRFKIQGMTPWKGDRSYRDTTVAYLKILNSVFNEDYAKIVNMEEIAEQSYDAMEAYMLAQEKATEKLEEAAARQQQMQKNFAGKYNVNLINTETTVGQKSKVASALMKHYDDVYLLFFKTYKQEGYLIEAVNKKNVIGIEENNSAMKKFAEDGLQKLKSLNGYNNDPSLIVACRQVQEFYKSEADQTQAITDFLLKEENFGKLKKNFEARPAAKRTPADIETYNNAIKDFNAAVNQYNKTNQAINKDRQSAINNWNDAVRKYLDNYMPVQRKQ
jgi:hypothetical protein